MKKINNLQPLQKIWKKKFPAPQHNPVNNTSLEAKNFQESISIYVGILRL
jgi:hypothetical protein